MTHRARIALLAAAVGGAALPVTSLAAQADARPTVAVMFFDNNVFTANARDYDGLGKGIADFLVTELAANPGIRVIERDQVRKLVDEQKLVAGSQVDRATAVRIGRLLGAQHVIFGGYMADAKGNFRIDARAVGVEQGVVEYTERVQDQADNVMGLIGTLAAKLAAGMHLPAAPTPESGAAGAAVALAGGPRATMRLPVKYAVMYGRALDLADRGETARAVALFGAVLSEFPDFAPAKRAKAKLTTGG